MSDQSTIPIQGKQLQLDSTAIFLPYDGIVAENSEKTLEKHSLFETTSASQSDEVRLVMEESSSTSKMHRIKALFRHTVPDFITCQRLWYAIDISIIILLLALYITKAIHFSAHTVAICVLLLNILVRNGKFIGLLHCLVGWIPFLKYEIHRTLHCIGNLHGSIAVSAFFWFFISLAVERHDFFVIITGGIILFIIAFLCFMRLSMIRPYFYTYFERIHRYLGHTCLIVLIIHIPFLQLEIFGSFTMKSIFNIPVLALIVTLLIIFLPSQCTQYKQLPKELKLVTLPRKLGPYDSIICLMLDGYEWRACGITLPDQCTDEHPILKDQEINKSLEYVWVREIKARTFLHSIHAYRRVLIVCTGSDIVPVLPYIKEPLSTTHIHLLWIGQQYEANYGETIWELVQKTSPNFILHDTAISGQATPELIECHFWKTNSEAVFIVSNKNFTREAMNTLWRKGIDCFGDLFDA